MENFCLKTYGDKLLLAKIGEKCWCWCLKHLIFAFVFISVLLHLKSVNLMLFSKL